MVLPMTEIVGNEGLRRRLCDEILGKTISHAYILSGAKGSGKRTIAMMCAAALACENKGNDGFALPCTKCPSCRKILEGKSPDVITIEKSGASVKVEQIRELGRSVKSFPNELEYKTYIIEDTQTMTPQAQNALLLTLEEPPKYVIFFLLCEAEEKLLETIKSRAPLLRTEPIDSEGIRKYLIEHSPDAKKLASNDKNELDAIISIANGSIGKALELTDEKARLPFMKQRETAEKLIELTFAKNTRGLIELIISLPPKQDELIPIINCAETALRDLILLKKSEETVLCFYSNREDAAEKAYSVSLSNLLSLYSKLGKAKETLMRNANIKLTLTALLANIQ